MDFYLFFQHFLMNSIPKEANFLAGSGGSGSGYGGGWDSVQRFDHGSVGSGCSGHWEPTQALPEEKAYLSPSLLPSVQEADLFLG